MSASGTGSPAPVMGGEHGARVAGGEEHDGGDHPAGVAEEVDQLLSREGPVGEVEAASVPVPAPVDDVVAAPLGDPVA
jgi:hypothetical protein